MFFTAKNTLPWSLQEKQDFYKSLLFKTTNSAISFPVLPVIPPSASLLMHFTNSLLNFISDLFAAWIWFNWTCQVGGSDSAIDCMLEFKKNPLSVRKKNVWNNTVYQFLHSVVYFSRLNVDQVIYTSTTFCRMRTSMKAPNTHLRPEQHHIKKIRK